MLGIASVVLPRRDCAGRGSRRRIGGLCGAGPGAKPRGSGTGSNTGWCQGCRPARGEGRSWERSRRRGLTRVGLSCVRRWGGRERNAGRAACAIRSLLQGEARGRVPRGSARDTPRTEARGSLAGGGVHVDARSSSFHSAKGEVGRRSAPEPVASSYEVQSTSVDPGKAPFQSREKPFFRVRIPSGPGGAGPGCGEPPEGREGQVLGSLVPRQPGLG